MQLWRAARHLDELPPDASGAIDALEARPLSDGLSDHQALAVPPLRVGIPGGEEQEFFVRALHGREQERGARLVMDACEIGEVAVLPAAAGPVGSKAGEIG